MLSAEQTLKWLTMSTPFRFANIPKVDLCNVIVFFSWLAHFKLGGGCSRYEFYIMQYFAVLTYEWTVPSVCTSLGVGLQMLACWDCGFETHRGYVCCQCCVCRGLCDELITPPEESYGLWCVVVCDVETSWMRPLYSSCPSFCKIFWCLL